MLSNEQIEQFIETGILVIPSILNEEEIKNVRAGFHQTLSSYGCDVTRLEETGKSLAKLSSTKGAGGVLDLFYMDWKLALNEHEKVVRAIQELWKHTYAIQHPHFEHPFGSFNPERAYMAIDRVCFRLPDQLSQLLGKSGKYPLQRSLTPHLDCCPHKPFTDLVRWKPIQCFLALTDAMEANHGGFEACPGFHKEISTWASQRLVPTHRQADTDNTTPATTATSNDSSTLLDQLCVGHYTAIRTLEDAEVISRFQSIPYRAGDLICWDYRIPHANAFHHRSDHPREVVYIGLLPEIALNRQFAIEQLERYRQGILPVGFWHKSNLRQSCDYDFSALGRKLMTIDPW